MIDEGLCDELMGVLKTFEIGDSMTRVKKVLGEPDGKMQMGRKGTWLYEDKRIEFEGNYVSSITQKYTTEAVAHVESSKENRSKQYALKQMRENSSEANVVDKTQKVFAEKNEEKAGDVGKQLSSCKPTADTSIDQTKNVCKSAQDTLDRVNTRLRNNGYSKAELKKANAELDVEIVKLKNELSKTNRKPWEEGYPLWMRQKVARDRLVKSGYSEYEARLTVQSMTELDLLPDPPKR